MMQIIKTINEMQSLSRKLRAEGKNIGLVPTMGALHQGHISLVNQSKAENALTIVSIFVNPAQFGPNEDFSKYPRDNEGDIKKLSAVGVDVVFMPDSAAMYPDSNSLSIDLGVIGQTLCGRTRPGHFNGVATVVAKLFNIAMPDKAYFGQKDFQQTVVIKKLVRDLDFDIDIIICPVVREPDGLAMSSRNRYLNNKERTAAAILFRALKLGEELILSGGIKNSDSVKGEIKKLLESEPSAAIEYIEIVSAGDLKQIENISQPAAICIAIKIGNTRLIDNIMVEPC